VDVVIGDDVVGLSIAYELARRPASPSILARGPGHRAGAASVAAAAMLNTFGEVTKYTLLTPAAQAKLQLCREAVVAGRTQAGHWAGTDRPLDH
jgi:glycine oxidase